MPRVIRTHAPAFLLLGALTLPNCFARPNTPPLTEPVQKQVRQIQQKHAYLFIGDTIKGSVGEETKGVLGVSWLLTIWDKNPQRYILVRILETHVVLEDAKNRFVMVPYEATIAAKTVLPGDLHYHSKKYLMRILKAGRERVKITWEGIPRPNNLEKAEP